MRIIPWTPKHMLRITPQKIALLYGDFKYEAVEVKATLSLTQALPFTGHNTFIDQNRFPTV